MSRPVTPLTVAEGWFDGSSDGSGETSSTCPALAARAEALFLPKLSFHFDGFLVTGGGTTGEAKDGGAFRGKRAVGIAYMLGGSNGIRVRRDEEALVLVDTDR